MRGRRGAVVIATAGLSAVLTLTACTSDPPSPAPSTAPSTAPSPSATPDAEPDAFPDLYRRIPAPALAEAGADRARRDSGRVRTAQRPVPPCDPGADGRTVDTRRTLDHLRVEEREGDVLVVRDLTLFRSITDAGFFEDRAREPDVCPTVEGATVVGTLRGQFSRDPRAPRRLPDETRARTQRFDLGGDAGSVVVVDLLVRRDNAVVWTRLVDSAYEPDVGPLDPGADTPLTGAVEAEARRDVALLDLLRLEPAPG